MKKAWTASAPGSNGVPYRLYKNSPNIVCFQWRQMRMKQTIPKAWRRAGGVVIPKEKDASNIDQFWQINLLNVEGKVFSIVAKRMTNKTDSWTTWFLRMLGAYKHNIAPNPSCQKGKKRLTCPISGPRQGFWIRP